MRTFSLRGATAAALILAMAAATPAAAQFGATTISDPNAALAASMRTLAREPRNMDALIAAGRASLELGDLQAAAGFFGRAEEAYPRSPMPKIGMGAAMTMSGQPSSALTYFARAAALGAPPSMLALDRGMAYDLLGQQPQAQIEYRLAMVGVAADEARRRLALSLAIGRDIKGAAATIEPLLRRGDREAVRVNAFILALAGDREGARRTIDAAMPGKGAEFEPFFRLLPVLRPNEKAAAVHLGEFPKDAAQRYASAQSIPLSPVVSVGRTGDPGAATSGRTVESLLVSPPRVARAAPQRLPQAGKRQPQPAHRAEREVESINTWLASVRPSLNPAENPASRRSRPKDQVATPSGAPTVPSADPVVLRPSAPPPAPPPAAQSSIATEPTVELVEIVPATPSERDVVGNAETERKVETATIDLPSDPLRPADNADQDVRQPSFAVTDSPPPAPTPKLEIETPPPSRPKVELASREIGKSRSAAKDKAKTSKPAEPDVGAKGTFWVQLAGSGSKENMAAEFRKIRAKKPDLFKGQPGHVTVGKDYFRLLIGPFDDSAEAHAFVTKLDKAGIDSFAWTRNPAQIKIEKLASR
ncbi:SPOR domain-containing protein [Sphingomonas mesophila]|uniref:SPOR domain-containing protein n=1 Tax=Sphingomonas mesophila TaxID=2303576 RepID=UPI0013C358DC|nr:SPOR domain-containing protein [Sphingomonas mesophila]